MIRILKLFPPGFLIVCVVCLCGQYAEAASPSLLCGTEQIQKLHGERRYPLDDKAFIMHVGSVRLGLSRMELGEKLRAELPGHGMVLILERMAAEDPKTYEILARPSTLDSLTRQAQSAGRSMVYISIADPHSPTSPKAILPGLRVLMTQPAMDTHEFMAAMCASLPKDLTLESVHVEHGIRGSSWSLRLLDKRGKQIGALIAWLDATQTERARSERWVRWGGIVLLAAVVALMGSLMWRRRKRRALPAWQETSGDMTGCVSCGRKSKRKDELCGRCQDLLDAGDPLTVAHHRATTARRDVLVMLVELDALASADQRLLAGLFGADQRIATHSARYSAQCALIEPLCEELHTLWFESSDVLVGLLGFPDVLSAPPYVHDLQVALTTPSPEFARAAAPEPWMSHLVELYTLLEVMELELDLRRRPASSLILWPSHD